jgi:4-aminobutyrate aminotransferase
MKKTDPTVRRAAEVFTPALHTYYPFTVAGAEGVHVHSVSGKTYMDFSSGLAVLNIGHNHPRVLEAVRRQLSCCIHTGGIYYSESTVAAAEHLVSITPEGLDMVFFSNSGAEAVEGALKLARYATGRQGIVSFTGAFHGRTLGAVSVTTSSAKYRKNYHPLLPSVYQVPYPNCFRCAFGCERENCSLRCLGFLAELLEHQISPEEVAAIIIEPVLGEGGYYPAPGNFMTGLRQLCSRHGILLIADEVQSGMGRTGKWFAVEQHSIVPDIMTVAKGIASGFPLSAVVSTSDIMRKWPPGAHGTTFGGNPVSCAAATATIEVIREEGLLEKSTAMGAEVIARLEDIYSRYPVIGNVRGYGFMIGIEFVDDRGEADGAACQKVLNHCLKEGLILIGCGRERNIIRFIPPLVATGEQVQGALDILETGVKAL